MRCRTNKKAVAKFLHTTEKMPIATNSRSDCRIAPDCGTLGLLIDWQSPIHVSLVSIARLFKSYKRRLRKYIQMSK